MNKIPVVFTGMSGPPGGGMVVMDEDQYEIRNVRGKPYYGSCIYGQKQIEINKDAGEMRSNIATFHELIHGIRGPLSNYPEKERAAQHEQIEKIAFACDNIYHIIRDIKRYPVDMESNNGPRVTIKSGKTIKTKEELAAKLFDHYAYYIKFKFIKPDEKDKLVNIVTNYTLPLTDGQIINV